MPSAHAKDTDSSYSNSPVGGLLASSSSSSSSSSTVNLSIWSVATLAAAALTGAVFGLAFYCLLLHPFCHHRQIRDNIADSSSPIIAVTESEINPMLSVVSAGAAAGMGGMDRLRGGGRAAARELAASRDRQVRLHAVRTDITLNLPPSLTLPDGEEHLHHNHHHHHHRNNTSYSTAASRLQIRDAEQESEIYQKCIRPPPNRTVTESAAASASYRSNSAGVLASSSSSSSCGANSDWSTSTSSGYNAPLVRCHSSSTPSGGSSHHHYNVPSSHQHSAAAQQGGQKTDFLQRTVKIFTGGKKATITGSSASACSSSNSSTNSTNQQLLSSSIPCVTVPVTSSVPLSQQNFRNQSRRVDQTGPGGNSRPPV